ncbi:hypothetical protein HDV00_000565 [Rhizophlyctis rosea]|nr:hypothetical protein HDV00_000565 [Rhizophlyctis rosea]
MKKTLTVSEKHSNARRSLIPHLWRLHICLLARPTTISFRRNGIWTPSGSMGPTSTSRTRSKQPNALPPNPQPHRRHHAHSNGSRESKKRNHERREQMLTKKQKKKGKVHLNADPKSVADNRMDSDDVSLHRVKVTINMCRKAGVRRDQLMDAKNNPTDQFHKLTTWLQANGHIPSTYDLGSFTTSDNETLLVNMNESFHMTAEDQTTLINYYRQLTPPIVAAKNGLIFHRLNASGKGIPPSEIDSRSMKGSKVKSVHISKELLQVDHEITLDIFAWPCGVWKDCDSQPHPTKTEKVHRERLKVMYEEPIIQHVFKLMSRRFKTDYPELWEIYQITFVTQFLYLIEKADEETLDWILFLFAHLPMPWSIWMPQTRWSGPHRDCRDGRCGLCCIYCWFIPVFKDNVGRSIFKSAPLGARIPFKGGDAIALRSFLLEHEITDCEGGRGCSVFFTHNDQFVWVARQLGEDWIQCLRDLNTDGWSKNTKTMELLKKKLPNWKEWLDPDFLEVKIKKVHQWLKEQKYTDEDLVRDEEAEWVWFV